MDDRESFPPRLSAGATVDRLVELAQTRWLNAQRVVDDIVPRHQPPSAATRARWGKAILDGYELPRARRVGFIDHMIAFAISDAASQAIDARITPDTQNPPRSGPSPGAPAAPRGCSATGACFKTC